MTVAKLLLLGEIGVGKTSLARRLAFDQFDARYKATIGTDIYRYEVVPSPTAEPFHFNIWDTDGNFGESMFRHVYARHADAAMIIADASRAGTIDAAVRLGLGFIDTFPGRPAMFCINKIDLLPADTETDFPAGMIDSGLPIMRTSAKTGDRVADAFRSVAQIVARRS